MLTSFHAMPSSLVLVPPPGGSSSANWSDHWGCGQLHGQCDDRQGQIILWTSHPPCTFQVGAPPLAGAPPQGDPGSYVASFPRDGVEFPAGSPQVEAPPPAGVTTEDTASSMTEDVTDVRLHSRARAPPPAGPPSDDDAGSGSSGKFMHPWSILTLNSTSGTSGEVAFNHRAVRKRVDVNLWQEHRYLSLAAGRACGPDCKVLGVGPSLLLPFLGFILPPLGVWA